MCGFFLLTGAGLLKLHDDVETCGYEDVKVMWEMLRRSESELVSHQPKRKQRPFWRVSVWSNHAAAASSYTATHAWAHQMQTHCSAQLSFNYVPSLWYLQLFVLRKKEKKLTAPMLARHITFYQTCSKKCEVFGSSSLPLWTEKNTPFL